MPKKLFQPGVSGNPAGRPVGSKNRLTALREALITPAQAREVVETLVKSAREGNVQAAGLILDRIYPRLRPTSPAIAFPLPEADLASQAETVVREMADGALPVQDAAAILASLSAVARIREVSDFEARLKALEKRGFTKEAK